MSWKHELDALIESTMTFVQDVKRQHPAELQAALRTAEQALLDTPASSWLCLTLTAGPCYFAFAFSPVARVARIASGRVTGAFCFFIQPSRAES
jgi:hypothetical protein